MIWVDNNQEVQKIKNTIESRYPPEKGFERKDDISNFGRYLRNLPLKPVNGLVKYYDGSVKQRNNVYSGVIDLPIGKKNLHQCADAIIRLRADYFYKNKRYDDIHFNLTNGFLVEYTKWREGYRVKVEGNTTTWVKKEEVSNTQEDYWKYLEFIFTYAGTLSLSKELRSISIEEARIGDVFIRGGSPGHAIIIIDEIIDIHSKNKMYLLAQSYMPAQELQILNNSKVEGSWYSFEGEKTISTPEWNFSINDLKRF